MARKTAYLRLKDFYSGSFLGEKIKLFFFKMFLKLKFIFINKILLTNILRTGQSIIVYAFENFPTVTNFKKNSKSKIQNKNSKILGKGGKVEQEKKKQEKM